MGSEEWVPEGIDVEQPSPARTYDYWLGGAHDFAADRRVAEQMVAAYPGPTVRSSDAVEFLVEAGVRQFLDIGSGIPTVGHVHEIAQARAPESRVVFVDVDPVAVTHSRLMLKGNERTAVLLADVRRPEQILNAPQAQQRLDFEQPVGVLVVGLFHFISDADDPARILSRLTKPLASGSYLVLSHATEDGPRDSTMVKEIYRRAGIEFSLRNRTDVEGAVRGLRTRGTGSGVDAIVAS